MLFKAEVFKQLGIVFGVVGGENDGLKFKSLDEYASAVVGVEGPIGAFHILYAHCRKSAVHFRKQSVCRLLRVYALEQKKIAAARLVGQLFVYSYGKKDSSLRSAVLAEYHERGVALFFEHQCFQRFGKVFFHERHVVGVAFVDAVRKSDEAFYAFFVVYGFYLHKVSLLRNLRIAKNYSIFLIEWQPLKSTN